MTRADDFPGDMDAFPFDHDLVRAARRPGSADELVAEDGMVAEIAAAIGEHTAPPRRGANERILVLQKYRTARVAAAATAALVLGGGVAAAATGTLPTPGQPHHHVELAAAHESAVVEADHAGEHEGVFGAVTSVNGVSDPGTCGTAGAVGSFTITDRDGNPFTVDVGADTKFFGGHDHDGAASFADVCVGQKAGARGDATDSTVAAAMVFALGDHHADNHEGDDNEVAHHEADDQGVEQPDAEHDQEHEAEHEDQDESEVEQPEVEQPEVEQPDTEHHDGEHDGGSDQSGSDHGDD